MAFLILIFILIILFFLSYLILKSQESYEIKNNIPITMYEFDGTYLGGFPDLEGGKNIVVKVKQNSLYLTIKNTTKIIPSYKIRSVEIMSQQQITNAVNVGSLLVLGIFAFALPNKTRVQNYLVITYKDDHGKERSIIIDAYSKLEEKVKDIKKNLRLS